MPEPGEFLRHGFHRTGYLRVNGRCRIDRPTDPQAQWLPLGGLEKRLRDFGPIRVTRQVAGHGIEAERGVRHRARDDPAGRQPGPVFAKQGATGDPPAGRLQPDDAATRGRDPDRATAVPAVGEATEPCGDGRGGAATGTTRRPALVNRVTGRRKHRTLGYRTGPELGRIRFPEDDRSLLFQTPDWEAVDLRDGFFEHPRGQAVAIAGQGRRLLDRDRHTVQQAQPFATRDPFFGGRRLALRQFARQEHIGVELGINARDALVVERDQLCGFQLLRRDGPGLLECRLQRPGLVDHAVTLSAWKTARQTTGGLRMKRGR